MTATPHATAAVPRLRRLADAIDAVVDRLSEPRAFAAAVAGYYVVAFLIRTLVLTGSSGDEAQTMLYGQGFVWIRSEVHTSALQSLMRTSYVVFRSQKININK